MTRSKFPVPLTAIVIDNQSATHGWPGGIAARAHDTSGRIVATSPAVGVFQPRAETRAGTKVRAGLQGAILLIAAVLTKEKIKQETERVLGKYGSGPGHIFNLGHGILPETPVENVKALAKFVQEYSTKI